MQLLNAGAACVLPLTLILNPKRMQPLKDLQTGHTFLLCQSCLHLCSVHPLMTSQTGQPSNNCEQSDLSSWYLVL